MSAVGGLGGGGFVVRQKGLRAVVGVVRAEGGLTLGREGEGGPMAGGLVAFGEVSWGRGNVPRNGGDDGCGGETDKSELSQEVHDDGKAVAVISVVWNCVKIGVGLVRDC